jgi:cell division protein FtsB
VSFWTCLGARLGIDDLHTITDRQEYKMGKLSDELSDLSRRNDALATAVAALTDDVAADVADLNTQIAALRDGDLSADQQDAVDAIKASSDSILAKVQAADATYKPPVIEPAPIQGNPGEPAPGSVEAINTGSV